MITKLVAADKLPTQINTEYRACMQAAGDALEHAMRCGDLLIQAKASRKHGEWQPWLEEHFDGSKRSAQAYMQVAVNRELIEAKSAGDSALLSLDGAMKLLAAPIESDELGDDELGDDEPKEKKPWLTVDEWNAMDGNKWEDLLNTPSKAKFNKQSNAGIEWAQWSWNPVTGCKHDCPYCYARDIANRFYPQKFEPSIYANRLAAPRNTNVPVSAKNDIAYRNVFTCSMADLFGRWVPDQ